MLKRREFFQVLGGGIVVLFTADEEFAQRRGSGEGMPKEIGAWLHIGEDGAITVYTGKAEMGQNIRTSLAQAVAEELHAPLASIHMRMGDTDLTPYDSGTSGSRTTPSMAPQLRKAAAAAREVLIDLAAEKWKRDRSSLAAADGKVIDTKTKQSTTFGELTKGQKLVKTIGEDVRLTPADKWRIAGKSVGKVTGRAVVTGRHEYPSDIKRPGMLYGRVLRPRVSTRRWRRLTRTKRRPCRASPWCMTATSPASPRRTPLRPRAPSRRCGPSGIRRRSPPGGNCSPI